MSFRQISNKAALSVTAARRNLRKLKRTFCERLTHVLGGDISAFFALYFCHNFVVGTFKIFAGSYVKM